ncbi:aminotransferase-like domain-containing protein [Cohnella fermenti]|uniref:PLP-dependent aminotransferase family protein n=1 Tax=Cohnella fermenti TaxID=2565925 RepID=A0A4S4BPQ7_9BACL|nr:PLP-dependent aminotransferase family protein [Cohnella fermenti]THF76882.1 PLP-dependent aminotransferase family protein [Cohnella fermenti]
MPFTLNRDSKEPLFRQLVRQMESRILSGEWPLHMKLPPERSLALQLGLNRSTVTAAYQELATQGWVSKVQGSGTRVIALPEDGAAAVAIDWNQYWNKRADNPLLPLKKSLHSIASRKGTINLAMGELSGELLRGLPLFGRPELPSIAEPLGYVGPPLERRYRSIIASHLERYQSIDTDASRILLTSGAQQALYLIVNCLLKPGDAIAVEAASYAYSQNLFLSAGLRVFPIAMDEDGLVPEHLVRLYEQHKIRMAVVNPTYQNPTGTVLSLERRRRLYDICAARRIPIVEDDPYSLLGDCRGQQPPPSLKALYPDSDLILYIGTTSKVLTPALRTGWLVGPEEVIARLGDHRREIDNGLSPILQGIVHSLLDERVLEPHLLQVRTSLAERRDRALGLMRGHMSGLATWREPESGFYVWCRLNPSIRLPDVMRECEAEGVLIMPGTILGNDSRRFRITYSRASLAELEEGLLRVARAIRRAAE